jgi:hypothetical protein
MMWSVAAGGTLSNMISKYEFASPIHCATPCTSRAGLAGSRPVLAYAGAGRAAFRTVRGEYDRSSAAHYLRARTSGLRCAQGRPPL